MNEPQTLHDNLPHPAIEHNIIGSFYEVRNILGRGFTERVYQRALAHDLRASGLLVDTETPAEVRYRGLPVARFRTDLIVGYKVLVEIKALAQRLVLTHDPRQTKARTSDPRPSA
ncbi:MAG: GxxExxY protein [Gemmatimonadales bacterium]